jgi:predicted kinase
LSRALLAAPAPLVVAVGGFSGAGKSSVAAALAPRLAPAPGARVFNSDRLRKQLFGVDATARLPPHAYESAVSAHVYAALFAASARIAAIGWPVVVDAVFDRPEDRAAIETAATAAGARFFGVWLDVDLEDRLARVKKRRGDVSDATAEVLRMQMRKATGAIDWRRIDARRDVDSVAQEIAAAL